MSTTSAKSRYLSKKSPKILPEGCNEAMSEFFALSWDCILHNLKMNLSYIREEIIMKYGHPIVTGFIE